MLGGNPACAGLEMPTPRLPLELAWKLDTGGRILTAAAIRGGKAFVASDGGKIIAVDLKTGKPLWDFLPGPTSVARRPSQMISSIAALRKASFMPWKPLAARSVGPSRPAGPYGRHR